MSQPMRDGTINLPLAAREASVVADTVNAEARSFEVIWTRGAEVPRRDWWTGERYIEVLDVSDKAIRLDRLNSGRASVLNQHGSYALENVLGVVERAWIAKGEGRAAIKLSGRAEVAGLVSDIASGIIRNISVGYITHSMIEELREGMTIRRATDWEPVEISFVTVPADPDAGMAMRSAVQTYPCKIVRSAHADVLARMRMRQRALG